MTDQIIKFKKFRSPQGNINISLLSGHIANIGKDFISLPDFMWREAYASGAISEDMVSTDLNSYVEEKKVEIELANKKEEEFIKGKLEELFDNPVSFLDGKGKLVTRKAIAAIGKPVKADIIQRIWAEIVEERG